jgi:hypothetical protein
MKKLLSLAAVIFSVALNITVALAQTVSADGDTTALEQVKVEPLNLPNLPLKIETATPVHYGERFAIKYSVTNSTDKVVSSFKGIFFVFDVNWNLVSSEDYQIREDVAPRTTKEWAYLLRREANAGDRVVMVLEEVTGDDGIWRVDKAKLEANVKARVSGQTVELLNPSHEDNLALTDDDRKEIIKDALEEAIIKKHMSNLGFWDKQREDKTKDKLDVYLLKQNVTPELLPKLPGVNLILLNADEMQERANNETSIVYLAFKQFKAEGVTVVVSLDIYLLNSKLPGAQRLMGWGAGHTYVYRKENGKWSGRIISSWIV